MKGGRSRANNEQEDARCARAASVYAVNWGCHSHLDQQGVREVPSTTLVVPLSATIGETTDDPRYTELIIVQPWTFMPLN